MQQGIDRLQVSRVMNHQRGQPLMSLYCMAAPPVLWHQSGASKTSVGPSTSADRYTNAWWLAMGGATTCSAGLSLGGRSSTSSVPAWIRRKLPALQTTAEPTAALQPLSSPHWVAVPLLAPQSSGLMGTCISLHACHSGRVNAQPAARMAQCWQA